MFKVLAVCVLVNAVGDVLADIAGGVSLEDFEGVRELIAGGGNTKPSLVPWHAAIYRPEPQGYELICGGTLVAPNFVLTAAHCLSSGHHPASNLTSYQIVLGKTYRTYHTDLKNPNVQVMDVKRVLFDGRYRGRAGFQQYDIALVELTANASVTGTVRPASVDFSPRVPDNGTEGVVAGWGRTETGNFSETLKSVVLPYIPYETCFNSLQQGVYKSYTKVTLWLTADKFCGGFLNKNTSVCQGDSGGGFVVRDPHTNISVVKGIVSTDFLIGNANSKQCYSSHYTAFTNVGEHRYVTWLQQYLPATQTSDTRCPALRSTPGQLITCHLEEDLVNCSVPARVGTVATLTCERDLVLTVKAGHKSVTACRGGKWSRILASCIPQPAEDPWSDSAGSSTTQPHHGRYNLLTEDNRGYPTLRPRLHRPSLKKK